MKKLIKWIDDKLKEYKEQEPTRRRERIKKLKHEAQVTELKTKIEQNKAKQRKARSDGKPKMNSMAGIIGGPVISDPFFTSKKSKPKRTNKKEKEEDDGFGPLRGFE